MTADFDRPAGPRLISLTPAAIRAREWRRKKREAVAAADVATPNSANDVANGVAHEIANAPNGAVNMANARSRDPAIGVILVATATVLSAIGMTATVAYSMGTATGWDRFVIAALALAADVLTLVLPAASSAAWSRRRRAIAVAGVALWIVAAAITTGNLAGFIGTSSDSSITGRENASTGRELVLEQLARLRTERATIPESRTTEAIVTAIRNATKSRIDSERAALALAKRRDAIDAELGRLSAEVATLPAVGDADPSASTVAAVIKIASGGMITIADQTVARARIILLLMLPLFAGSPLALGLALLGVRRQEAA